MSLGITRISGRLAQGLRGRPPFHLSPIYPLFHSYNTPERLILGSYFRTMTNRDKPGQIGHFNCHNLATLQNRQGGYPEMPQMPESKPRQTTTNSDKPTQSDTTPPIPPQRTTNPHTTGKPTQTTTDSPFHTKLVGNGAKRSFRTIRSSWGNSGHSGAKGAYPVIVGIPPVCVQIARDGQIGH